MNEAVSFAEYKQTWLADVREGNPSTVQLGNRFAHKLIAQWLERDVDDSPDDLVYCDGSGDGGIDIAYLDRGDEDESGDAAAPGHTWYLVQSKYGAAFQGTRTLLIEGQKVIETLDGQRKALSSLADGLLERLTQFRRQASERDRIVLVFATEDPLTGEQKRALSDLTAIGQERLGTIFDVNAVSIETIYQRAQDEAAAARQIRVPIRGALVLAGDDLLVGSTPLSSLYEFLKAYRDKTGDLDQLYEKNVRRFLGSKGRVNRAIERTLLEEPERFGLYNNGIAIVVADFHRSEDGSTELVEPYVVNGCQTTRVIWEVCSRRLEAGGTGVDPSMQAWRQKLERGVVVTKIAKVGTNASSEDLLEAITRYTNSQNGVREKDFLTLTSDFRTWARLMGEQYGVFLEIQRGGWDSRRAMQKQKPDLTPQFKEYANAFDLLKVYGAGWLREAGLAFGRNTAFLPNGSVFTAIMSGDGTDRFGVDDLYAAYRLQKAADAFKFGRAAEKPSRKQARFLFYLVVLDLLRDIMTGERMPTAPKCLTRALLKLFEAGNDEASRNLLEASIEVIDEYLTLGTDNSVFSEPTFQRFNNDLNGYLKWERLGKGEDWSPRLRDLRLITKQTLGRRQGGSPSPRELIIAAITS